MHSISDLGESGHFRADVRFVELEWQHGSCLHPRDLSPLDEIPAFDRYKSGRQSLFQEFHQGLTHARTSLCLVIYFCLMFASYAYSRHFSHRFFFLSFFFFGLLVKYGHFIEKHRNKETFIKRAWKVSLTLYS